MNADRDPGVFLDVAPGTEEEDLPLFNDGETEVDIFAKVNPGLTTHIEVGASAWDADGVGIGGVDLTLSVSEAEELRDDLSSAIEEAA